jgi:regulator of nucleoside diphosphate kinase
MVDWVQSRTVFWRFRMSTRLIHITGPDMLRLRQLLAVAGDSSDLDRVHLEMLRRELDRAVVVNAEETPADVITMGTQVRVRDVGTGRRHDYTLVYPWEADLALGRVSVLAPLGTALIGHRSGDDFVWAMPGVVRRLRIEQVLHQPEAARRAGVAPPDAYRAVAAHRQVPKEHSLAP